MGIRSFGQNKVVRHSVDHKHTSVSFHSRSMVSLPCIDGRWSPQGSMHPISDPGELGIEIMFFLKGYSGAHMLFLPLTR